MRAALIIFVAHAITFFTGYVVRGLWIGVERIDKPSSTNHKLPIINKI